MFSIGLLLCEVFSQPAAIFCDKNFVASDKIVAASPLNLLQRQLYDQQHTSQYLQHNTAATAHNTTQHNTILAAAHRAAQHSTAAHNTRTQHKTAKYSKQHTTAAHNTTQHNTVQQHSTPSRNMLYQIFATGSNSGREGKSLFKASWIWIEGNCNVKNISAQHTFLVL